MSSVDTVARLRTPSWRAWLQLARVSNAPTVISDTVAGAVLVTSAAPAGLVAMVAAAIALFYTAGMILNDVLDYDVDQRERPERPLPSGQVRRGAATAAVVGLFATGAGLLALAGLESLLAGLGLIALIGLYDAWHKGNVLSPVLMGACRAMVYVVAGLAVAGTVQRMVWAAAGLLLVYVAGVTQIAKAERSGIAAQWPIVAVLAPAAYWAWQLTSPQVALLLAGFTAWSGYALWLVLGKRRIGAGVGRLIAGIALYDALVVVGADGSAAAAAVCLAAFVATSALQTRIAGT
jgi:UbiA prenyltransferase family